MRRSGTHAPRRGFRNLLPGLTDVILGVALVALLPSAESDPVAAGTAFAIVALLALRLEGRGSALRCDTGAVRGRLDRGAES